ncbi:MAG: DMT family transporter [Rhodospirillaceae bacterium]|nr:DMT family transporter [Rhodospirillaceae bacterium]
MSFVILLGCVLAGALLPIQASMNAMVGVRTSGPLFAVGVNFAVGTVILIAALAALRTPWPSLTQFTSLPWWTWLGGLLGAAVVFATLFSAPRLGAAVAFAAIVAGQMGMSLMCDTFGWLNYAQQPLTPGRIAGAVCLVAGVVLIRKF